MSKMKHIAATLAIVLWATGLFAQNFQIGPTDTTKFPEVKTVVSVKSNEQPQKTDFKVIEDGTPLEFTLKLVQENSNNKQTAVFLLVENSYYTTGVPLQNIKTGLSEALLTLNENKLLNVGSFNRAQADGKAFKQLSFEFTADNKALGYDISNQLTDSEDTVKRADVFKGIDECLDYIASRSNLPADRILIVISSAINSTKSPIRAEDVISKAQKTAIPVYSLVYQTANRYAGDNLKRISDQTNGESRTVASSSDVSNYIQDFVASFTKKAGQNQQCELSYNTAADTDGKEHKVEIEYKGERATAVFTAPKGSGSFLNLTLYIVISIIVLALIGLSIYVAMRQRQKRKSKSDAEAKRFKEMEEKNLRMQDEIKRRQLTNPGEIVKNDPKKTIISGSTAAPTLKVYLSGGEQTYTLKPSQISIGRKDSNIIVIQEQTISSSHAQINFEGGQYVLTDLNSTNGTFVNGKRITKQALRNGDLVRMGAIEMKFSQ